MAGFHRRPASFIRRHNGVIMRHDLAIRGGIVATATETFHADIGIRDGRIATLAESITDADDVIDANEQIVMPGGIEAHCHIAQESGMGVMTSDDYESGSISAAFGGNSCVPFAAQKTGQSLASTVQTYDDRATLKSVLDWSYHLILTIRRRRCWRSRGCLCARHYLLQGVHDLRHSSFGRAVS